MHQCQAFGLSRCCNEAELTFERDGVLRTYCSMCARAMVLHLVTTMPRVCFYNSGSSPIMIFERPQAESKTQIAVNSDTQQGI
jgi:hypothetical protein